MVNLESWEERTIVSFTLDQSVNSITISLDGCSNNHSVFIFQLDGLLHALSTSLNGFLVKSSSIVNSEADILNTISVDFHMFCEFFVSRVKG